MGLSILIVIIASMVLGFIFGVILARPRRWDLHICAGDTIRVNEGTSGFTRSGNHFPATVASVEPARAWPSPTSIEGSEKPLPSGSGGVTHMDPHLTDTVSQARIAMQGARRG
jgi:hypothetical protein